MMDWHVDMGNKGNDLKIIMFSKDFNARIIKMKYLIYFQVSIVYTIWHFKFFQILIARFSNGSLNFRDVSKGRILSGMSSIIYRRNQKGTSYPFLGSVFAQVSAGTSYRQFSNFCNFMVKGDFQLLQMKLQPLIDIIASYLTSPAGFKVIWQFLMQFEAIKFLVTATVDFTADQFWHFEIRFQGPQYSLVMILDILRGYFAF